MTPERYTDTKLSERLWNTGMAARQRIIPVRREYNRWSRTRPLEDYALRFTAKSARQFSSSRISHTAIGAISFLALEAIAAPSPSPTARPTLFRHHCCCGRDAAGRPADQPLRHPPRRRYRSSDARASFAISAIPPPSLIYAASPSCSLPSRRRSCPARWSLRSASRYGSPTSSRRSWSFRSSPMAATHQQVSDPDAALLDRPQRPAIPLHRPDGLAEIRSLAGLSPASHDLSAAPGELASFNLIEFGPPRRHSGADVADRENRLISCASCGGRPEQVAPQVWRFPRRCRLGSGRRSEASGGLLPGGADAVLRRAGGSCRRPLANVSDSLRLHDPEPHCRTDPDGGLRRRVAVEDQCDECLCGLACLVELLLPPDPQPSGPRRLAGLQRSHRAF